MANGDDALALGVAGLRERARLEVTAGARVELGVARNPVRGWVTGSPVVAVPVEWLGPLAADIDAAAHDVAVDEEVASPPVAVANPRGGVRLQ